MEKVRMNLEIDGHEYTIQKMNQKGTRELYHFNDRNSKGERIEVEFTKIGYKKGFIKELLENYWNIMVYVYDKEGNCYGRYNPQILPHGTKINFDWVLEATEENKDLILHEIIKRTYNCKNK